MRAELVLQYGAVIASDRDRASRLGRTWRGIPGIERAANGRLWATFYTGGPKEPHPDNVIVLRTSADDGIAWSEPQVIVAPKGATRAYDPCLWHDPAGRLWLFYNQANVEEGVFDLWAMTTADSDSVDPVWDEPRRIEVDVPFAFRMNKPCVLADGTWLLPVTWARTTPEGWFPAEGQLQGVAISSDAGASWTLHGAVEAPHWALENMVVQLRDGRVWMLIRAGGGFLWQSISEDGGLTWSKGESTAIINPGTRFYIGRLASGRLLLINTPHPTQRTGLVATLSDPEDEMTFSGELVLDPREHVSYPDAVQAPDGRIFSVHDRERYGAGEILLRVFREM
jgi:predicted neuraminidase